MATSAAATNLCLCGCGEHVRGQWKRGHAARGEGGYHQLQGEVIPGPGETLDLGEADPDYPPGMEPGGSQWAIAHEMGWLGEPGPEVEQDPLPGSPVAADPTGKPGAPAAVRVTVAMRKDIEAKIGIGLEIPGRVWEARDPLCGGSFIEQVPAIRRAFLGYVLASPDLIAWFTGPAAGFMRLLDLLAALLPVAQMILAHHVFHSVELERRPEQNGAGPAPAAAPVYVA